MPRYDFECSACGTHTAAYRPFSERERSEPCPSCGESAEVVFTPNGNVWIPSYHTAQHGVSWSQVHGDRTEKDLAKVEGVELQQHAMSQPDRSYSDKPEVSDSTLATLA